MSLVSLKWCSGPRDGESNHEIFNFVRVQQREKLAQVLAERHSGGDDPVVR
jgi:hypothetical protein